MSRVIGIDPGKHTGLADLRDGHFELLLETTFWGAYDYILEVTPPPTLLVIEVSPLRQTKLWHDHEGRTGKSGKIGQDVGGVRLQGQLLADRFQWLGYEVLTMPPPGKLDHARFCRLTGYNARTNPHKRDAGMLAWWGYHHGKHVERVSA